MVGADRAAWRRHLRETVAATARVMSAKETTTAERVRLAGLVEAMVSVLEMM